MLAMSTIPVIVLIVAVVYAVSAQREAARANDEVDRSNAARQTLAAIRVDLAVAESSARGYLLTVQPAMLSDYEEAVRDLRRDLAELDASLVDERQRARLHHLDELVTDRLEVFRIILREAGADHSSEGQAGLETQLLRGQEITDLLQEQTESMRATADELAAQQISRRDRAFERSYLVQVLALPVAILVAMIMMVTFTAGIVRRVAKMRQNAIRLDQGRKLDPPDRSGDELGSLSRALVRTGTHLTELQEELRRHATVDDLTGLSNRRGFFALGEHQLLVAARTRSSVALLFVDVDGLKRVNDELGHVVGDFLLKETAEVIQETIRGSDIAGRLGGDEFCVLLMGDPELDPDRVVQRMQDTLSVHNARPGRTYHISLAMGISALPPGRSVTLEELIDAADEQMYEDKRARQTETQAVWSV
jgi:diguanylate cyclase (GGDEF)-like protein